MVQHTIMVPQYVTETQKQRCTEWAQETRQCKYTVYRCVPETKTINVNYTEMVPEQRTRTETYCVQVPHTRTVSQQYQVQVPTYRDVQQNYTVCVPVWKDQAQEYTVMVPYTETRQATRQEMRCTPVSETRTVTVDRGHWEQVACNTGCGGCGNACATNCGFRGCGSCGNGGGSSCCATQQRWVANCVQEPIQVTVMKQECVNIPYDYQVTLCRPEKHTQTVKVCSYENQTRTATRRICEYRCETRAQDYQVTECSLEQRTREVPYTVCVAQARTRQEQITEYRQVPTEQVQQYTVMVPHEVERDVQVQVCHMVPQTVTVPAQTCCDNGCGGRLFGRRLASRGCCAY
jgi:hypothetical protein